MKQFGLILSISIASICVNAQNELTAPIRSGSYSSVQSILQNKKYDSHTLGYALVNTFLFGPDSVVSERERIATLLVENGADINTSTAIGTPLMLAIKAHYRSFAVKLIAIGADVNAIKEREQTALMFSCANGDFELSKLLIQKGADVNAKGRIHAQDSLGAVTPLKIAKEKKHESLVRLLIENGANE